MTNKVEPASVTLPPPEGGGSARLIVCEQKGHWAAVLRRELAGAGVRLVETRSITGCWEELAAAPASFLVVEFRTVTAEELLGHMARLPQDFPAARLAVVADRPLAAYEWLMREAGAVHFTCSPRRLDGLARLACRHLAHAPAPQQTFSERIWATLPWKSGGQ